MRVAAGLAGIGTAVAAAGHLAQRAAGGEPWFPVEAVEVRGLRLLEGEEILAASGVEVGAGLFSVDLDSVAARLDRLVWVRSVRVERKPPDRLVVHLTERRRVAWVEWQGRLHGLDDDGVLLPPDRLPAEGVGDLDLPVLCVSGLGAAGGSPILGRVVSDSTVLRLLGWLRQARDQAPDLAAQISEISALDDDALRLRMVADDLEVRVPGDRVGVRMATLRQVLGRVYRECRNPVYVDLRFEGQAVVGTLAPGVPVGEREPTVPGRLVPGEVGHG